MIDLRANPFFLDDEGIRWVNETLASMTVEEKAGQVFCPLGLPGNEEVLRGMICGLGVGGIGMPRRTGQGTGIWTASGN